MVVRPWFRELLSALVLYGAAAAGIAYFAFHGWNGAHGLQAQRGFDVENARLYAELAVVKAERAALQQRVELLRPETIDPDMLDERARALLNLAHPNDLVLLRPSRQPAPAEVHR